MWRNYEPLIPKDVHELLDHLAMMVLTSPTFATSTFPDLTADDVFLELNEGLKNVRGIVGEEVYMKGVDLSERAREDFVADPQEHTGEARSGRQLLIEMRELLSQFGD